MNTKLFYKAANGLIFGLAVGISIAGCGGGGSGSTSIGSAVSGYLADMQGNSFIAYWWYSGGASSVYKADVSTIIPSGTNQYSGTTLHKVLYGGTWETDPSHDEYYNLIASGWSAGSDTGTLTATGGDNLILTPAGEPGTAAVLTRTDLSNTAIACTNPSGSAVACTNPGSYPVGSAQYQLAITYTLNQYLLYGTGIATPITNTSGTPLTQLPTLNAETFCDPSLYLVFKPQGATNTYEAFAATSCSSLDIASAITTSVLGTVTLNSQATGNTTVPNVLRVVSATGSTRITGKVGMIYGLRESKVWYGWMMPAGTYLSDPEQNKIAANAKLLASGLIALP